MVGGREEDKVWLLAVFAVNDSCRNKGLLAALSCSLSFPPTAATKEHAASRRVDC